MRRRDFLAAMAGLAAVGCHAGPAAAGTDYETYARRQLFGPLGMTASTNDWRRVAVGRMLAPQGAGLYRPATIAAALGECTGGRFDKSPAFWLKGPANRHGCFGALQSAATAGHPGYTGSMLSFDPASGTTIAIVSNGIALHGDFGNYGRLADALLAAVG